MHAEKYWKIVHIRSVIAQSIIDLIAITILLSGNLFTHHIQEISHPLPTLPVYNYCPQTFVNEVYIQT